MRSKSSTPLFRAEERQCILGLSCILFCRMSGLFLLLPVFSVLAQELPDATPALVGLALGAYGLTQALLQIPFGLWSDHIGRRPVIAFGLVLFCLGSVLGAIADSVQLIIIARLLQGTGAISSAIFALIADLTRPEVRTRANAGLGMSIGLAFGIAILAAPLLGEWFGLSGLFWVMAAMGGLSLVLLYTVVPVPQQAPVVASGNLQRLRTVFRNPELRVIDWGGFVCSAGLSAMFFLIPLLLVRHGFPRSDLWQIYLPLLFAGAATMIPAAILAETKNRFREVMLGGIVLLLVSLLCLGWGWHEDSLPWVVVSLFLFFMGFNVFEPIFPSLVTRLTTPDTKGAASGVYNLAQFFGYFLGASVAGMLYEQQFLALTAVIAVLEISFLYVTLSFPNPGRRNPKPSTNPTDTLSG